MQAGQVDCGCPRVDHDTQGRPRLIVEGGATQVRIVELPDATIDRLIRQLRHAQEQRKKATNGAGG